MRVALRSLRASGAFHSSALQRADKSPLASALATIKETVAEIMPEPAKPNAHPTSWNQVADRTASIMFMGDVFHGAWLSMEAVFKPKARPRARRRVPTTPTTPAPMRLQRAPHESRSMANCDGANTPAGSKFHELRP